MAAILRDYASGSGLQSCLCSPDRLNATTRGLTARAARHITVACKVAHDPNRVLVHHWQRSLAPLLHGRRGLKHTLAPLEYRELVGVLQPLGAWRVSVPLVWATLDLILLELETVWDQTNRLNRRSGGAIGGVEGEARAVYDGWVRATEYVRESPFYGPSMDWLAQVFWKCLQADGRFMNDVER